MLQNIKIQGVQDKPIESQPSNPQMQIPPTHEVDSKRFGIQPTSSDQQENDA